MLYEQEGSGAFLGNVVRGDDDSLQRVTVRNVSTVTITALRFVVVVERLPFSTPVRLFSSDRIAVSIPPGQSAQVSPNVLPGAQLQEVAAASGGRVQLYVGLQAVHFANGADWSITPNPAATNGRDALGMERPWIPRELLNMSPAPAAARALCRDQRGRGYSAGALVQLRNEPGRFARCVDGRWEESAVR
jgi:hypothetical protein